ncbi:BTAD domain-containing putative transcriptional regulator [Nocardia sp. NPDC051030]|uniref:AfsR/SARP family transcriptional regulator n=1 Tax=Nocardia sp. NPDC051030 TaxID=3155162 RepID=UPI00342B33AD
MAVSIRPGSARDSILVALLGEVALRRAAPADSGTANSVAAANQLTPVPGARARLLVAALATHPGRSRSAQALIEDIWGEEPPRAPMNALHTQVSRLRSALPEGVLEIGPAGYRLLLRPDQVDLTLAQQLEKQARQAHTAGDDEFCLGLVAAARDLWRGDPAADLPPGPVAEELAGLAVEQRRALDALELVAREAVGDFAGAIELALRAAAADPFAEPAHGTLMRLLAASGRTTEALDVFASLRTRLVEQLGADPGPALVALNTAILRGEPLPGSPPVRPTGTDREARAGTAPGYSSGSRHTAGADYSPDTNYAVASGDSSRTAVRGPDDFEDMPSGQGSGRSSRMASAAQHAAGERGGAVVSAIGLRAAPNLLLGREADLDELEGLLRRSRVTTILGPGGTGKTRVANELGARVAHERTVALVELASLRPDASGDAGTRTEVEAAIAATLGVGATESRTSVLRPNHAQDVRQRLREALASRPMLLILDNCEHLIDAVAEVVADLVGITGQLTVLTTSRSPLEITAEAVYPLPPLTIDPDGSPATDLFAARARAVRPSVRMDPEGVARLCHTLDGLPLAIELAAARVRTMSVEEIETRLDHRFSLLRSGDRSSPQRHRTLHAVIEWSWNLLDEEQRIALRRLCRFPAGFTLAAAETVIEGPEIADAATAVDGLVSQSLLTVLASDDDEGDGVRYRMLETVREFGEEQLELTGEAEAVMARMSVWAREFALDAVRRYPTDEQVAAVLATAAEADNLVAVLRYALERRDAVTVYTVFPVLCGLWVMRGAHLELISWSPRIMLLPPAPNPQTREEGDLQVFGSLALVLHVMYLGGGPREIRGIATMRARLRRMLAVDPPLSPMFRYLAGVATIPIREDGILLARKFADGVASADPSTRVAALLLRANVRENAGDVHGSTRDAVRALADGIAVDVWGSAMVAQHLGGLYGQSARYAESVDYYRDAADKLQRLRAYEEAIEIRAFLAVSLVGIGELEQARHELEPTMGVVGMDTVGDQIVGEPNNRRAAVAAALAEIELAEGSVDEGLRRYRQVLTLLDWPHGQASPGPGDVMLAAAVADAHVLQGHSVDVTKLVRELIDAAVLRLGQFWDLPQMGAVACAVGSHMLATGGDTAVALELLARAPRVFARQDYPSMQLRRHVDLHRAAVGAERMDAALNSAAGLGRRAAAERILAHMTDMAGFACPPGNSRP